MKWPSHGSNPQYLYEAMGMPLPNQFIDFSANINPIGPPEILKKNWNDFFKKIIVYPDPHALTLKQQIANKEHVAIDSLLVGNGGSELITLISRMLAGKKVLLIQPTFSEYEQTCRSNNCDITTYQLEAPGFELNLDQIRLKLQEANAMFLCNPNNPTGIRYSVPEIVTLIKECHDHDCLFILDEAFYDFLLGYQSFIPYIKKFPNLLIIRSMTKMFAIPGIRLGYLVGHPEMIAKLQKLQSHWSTNVIALAAGEFCIQEDDFIKETQAYIANERKRIFAHYLQAGFSFSSSEVNFYLLQDPCLQDQFPLFEYLLKKGIIARHSFNFPGLDGGWLRFAIKSTAENRKLMEVLAQWREYYH